MAPITLSEMDSVSLLNRVDTKYLTDEHVLLKVLEEASSRGYLVFTESGGRIIEYRSMYYDTPELQMYHDHHNRRLTRQKLRTRCYVSSGDTFLELKSKNNHGRTKKKRIEIQSDMYSQKVLANADELNWLSGKITYPSDDLTPALETLFSRITLVNPEFTERSTIDTGLVFRNQRNGAIADMKGLVVIEVKQDGNRQSDLREILLNLRVKPVRISKYCIGTAMTSENVKTGNFKKKIMLINKMKEQYD